MIVNCTNKSYIILRVKNKLPNICLVLGTSSKSRSRTLKKNYLDRNRFILEALKIHVHNRSFLFLL